MFKNKLQDRAKSSIKLLKTLQPSLEIISVLELSVQYTLGNSLALK